MPHVVILIPGIMGSELKLGDEVVWPGSTWSLIGAYTKMDQLLDGGVVATDCIRSFYLPQYSNLIKKLANWGFSEENKTLVICAYDWRKSNAESAKTLATRIDEVIAREGEKVTISLVAHSMGGLVARYYLESGKYSGASWNAVKNLITIATPHRGAALALPVVAGLEKRLFLSAAQVKQLCDDSRYPGAYELLPHSDQPVAWDDRRIAQIALIDIYDPAVAQQLGLNLTNLATAKAFHETLRNGSRPSHTNYFCFSGTAEDTATYVRIRERDNGLLADKVEQKSGGDATVPIWSSTLAGARFLYVPGEHGTIYQGDLVKQHLGALLGIEGTLAAGAPNEISVNPQVVEPAKWLAVRLSFGSNITEFDGRVAIQRLTMDKDGKVSVAGDEASYPLSYKGPEIDSFKLRLRSPEHTGHFQVSFFSKDAPQPAATSELIVQAPNH